MIGTTTAKRVGATLLELLVVITVMGIALGVIALAPSPVRRAELRGPDGIEALRRIALAEARDTTALVVVGTEVLLVTALRDGRVIRAAALANSNEERPDADRAP